MEHELSLDGENTMSGPVKAYFMAIVKRRTEHEVAEKLIKIEGGHRRSRHIWNVRHCSSHGN